MDAGRDHCPYRFSLCAAYVATVAEETELYGVLQPGESGAWRGTWHLVDEPLAPRSVCGSQILFGARLRSWDKTPPADRCATCLLSLEGI